MKVKEDKPFKIIIEGLDSLETYILPAEISLVHRILSEMNNEAIQLQGPKSGVIELCNQIGIKSQNS